MNIPKKKKANEYSVALITAAVSWSGVEVHTIHLANALMERGHNVVIVELGQPLYSGASLLLTCQVLHLNLGLWLPSEVPLESVGFNSWRRIFNSFQADIAISIKGTFKFGSLAMEAAGRLSFSRYLVIEHLHAPLAKRKKMRCFNGVLPAFGLWWYRQRLSGYLRSVFPQRVICVSHAVALTLKEDYCYPSSKLTTVHCGVDTNLFTPSSLKRHQARENMGVPQKAFVFGTLGRLSPMKNHSQLIRSFSKLCSLTGRTDLRLVIIGDGPLKSSLEALAGSSGVRELVVFGGFSECPEEICPAFDVFCFPSLVGESFGIALLEAMSCGVPPIAAEIGGVPEILCDPRLGWLVRSGDENELLSVMRVVADFDSIKLKKISAAVRKHVVSKFNSNDRWDEFVRVVSA